MNIPQIVVRAKKQVNGPSFLGSLPRDKFRLLIATILSARTRDVNTDRVVIGLFKKYPTALSMSRAKLSDIRRLVRSSGYYNQKARYVLGTARIIADKYKGKVPQALDSLLELPGVGRKVAGCVLVYGFGKADSIPVDTHVHRVFNRLGIVRTKTPEQTEKKLMQIIPKHYWITINEVFVLFGQQICKPRQPECWHCSLVKYCKYPSKTKINRSIS